MLGYSKSDMDKMTDAIHDAKLFYLKNNGKDEYMKANLEEAISFFDGLWAEGYFDNA